MSLGYIPGSGPLRRAHPFTPLTAALSFAVLSLAVPAPVGTSILLACAVALAVVEGVPQVLRPALLTALPFWIFLLVIHGFIREAPVTAVIFGLRITTIVLVFLIALAVVQPARLVDAFLERGMSFSVAYLFAATLHAVPRLRARARAILDAQRCRGLRIRGSLKTRARAVVPLTISLILSAVSEVDERAIALEARGAGQVSRRTVLHPSADPAPERVLRWLLIGLAAAAMAWKIFA